MRNEKLLLAGQGSGQTSCLVFLREVENVSRIVLPLHLPRVFPPLFHPSVAAIAGKNLVHLAQVGIREFIALARYLRTAFSKAARKCQLQHRVAL